MRLLTLPLAAAIVLAGALPAANAALPKFKNKKIVVAKSIGGVKLGGTVNSAEKAWGKSKCSLVSGDGACQWRVGDATHNQKGEGLIAVSDNKIVGITLQAPVRASGGYKFTKPFTVPKTSKKVGIGSKIAKVKKAHRGGTDSGGFYTLKKGGVMTIFSYLNSSKRVYSIRIERGG